MIFPGFFYLNNNYYNKLIQSDLHGVIKYFVTLSISLQLKFNDALKIIEQLISIF